MGFGFTLKTLKALNSFDINCFVLKVSKHWVSVLSYNYVWPRGPALFATLGVPNAAGSPETCRRASSHACYSTVTPICSVADLSRSNPNKPVFQVLYQTIMVLHLWMLEEGVLPYRPAQIRICFKSNFNHGQTYRRSKISHLI